MESEHLVELPNRAVAPEPDLGNDRGRPVGSILGLVSAWVPLAVASLCRPAVLRPRPEPTHRPASPCAWRSCQPLAHFVALEHTRLSNVSAEGHRSQFRTVPVLPASSRVSTAANYSGVRRPAFGVLRLPGECGCWLQLRHPAVTGAHLSPRAPKPESTKSCTCASRSATPQSM
jgi:hypothetical protein